MRIRYGDGRVCELGGAVAATTNNRMELWAAIQALRAVDGNPVSLITDSEYLLKGITEWIKGWKKRGWLTAGRKPVLNQDLWEELDRLNHCGVRWKYTRGHAGEEGNERCDELAQAFSRGEEPQLADGT